MATKVSKIPIEQIEIVNLHDLFIGEFELEAVCLKLLEEYPENLMDIRDERLWSAAGFVRFLDYWINSDLYHLVDNSFVYINKLWSSAFRLRKNRKGDGDDIDKKIDEDELQQNIEDFKAVCRVKEFLLAHPNCYVFNNVDDMESSDPFSLHKVSVVDYDKIVSEEAWDGVFDDYIDDSYNLLLTSDQVIRIIEEYFEISNLSEDDCQIVELDKAARFLEKNPSKMVALRNYYPFVFMRPDLCFDWN